MAFWVYILRCSDGNYYVGHTDNLEQRIAQHQSGEIPGYTRFRRPVELVFSEYFDSREQAFEQERHLKKWSRPKKDALARGDWKVLSELAKGRSGRRDGG